MVILLHSRRQVLAVFAEAVKELRSQPNKQLVKLLVKRSTPECAKQKFA
jgi:hypothetical protein